MNENWLLHDRKKVLWLHPNFRPLRSAMFGNRFAVGQGTGRIFFISLQEPFIKFGEQLIRVKWVTLRCVQSLGCSKLKYRLFFSAGRVSRHAGRSINYDFIFLRERGMLVGSWDGALIKIETGGKDVAPSAIIWLFGGPKLVEAWHTHSHRHSSQRLHNGTI